MKREIVRIFKDTFPTKPFGVKNAAVEASYGTANVTESGHPDYPRLGAVRVSQQVGVVIVDNSGAIGGFLTWGVEHV